MAPSVDFSTNVSALTARPGRNAANTAGGGFSRETESEREGKKREEVQALDVTLDWANSCRKKSPAIKQQH